MPHKKEPPRANGEVPSKKHLSSYNKEQDNRQENTASKDGFMLSVFENGDGRPLSKNLSLNREGKLIKSAAAELSRGRVVRRKFNSLEALGHFMVELLPTQAVAFGVCQHESALVLSQKRAARYKGAETIVTRTSDNFSWLKGAGVFLGDYDPQPDTKPLSADDLVAALRNAVPELRFVTMAMKPSASSCIFDEQGRELAAIKGQHIFIICKDAERIPEVGKLIAERLWLAGLGYIRLSDSGRMLERTIIDTSVWQPERLVFGGAACGAGLSQRFPAPRIFPGEYDELVGERWLDPSQLPPLTPEETERLSRMKAEAKAAKQDEAKRKQAEWIDGRAKKAAGDNADAETLARHRESFRRAVNEGDIMPPSLILYPQDGDAVTAEEILKNPDVWHGKRFADPFEPEYTNDPRIAMAVLTDCGEPYIHSHAHGGIRYLFRSEAERLAEIANAFDVLHDEAPDNQKAKRFETITAGEFIKRPRQGYIIKDVIPRGCLMLVYGGSGDGKTFVTMDMMLAVARGVPWNGKRVKKGRVVYVCAEDASGVALRLNAYCRKHKIEALDLPFSFITDVPNFRTMSDVQAIADSSLASGKVDIIVVDTLAQVTPGADENTGKDMSVILQHCQELHRLTGALVCLVHHAGKDESKGARGWSGIKAPLDAQIQVSREGDSRKIWIEKLKNGRDGYGWRFKLDVVILYLDDDGDIVDSCVVEYIGGAEKKRQPSGKWQKAALQAANDLCADNGEGVSTEDIISKASQSVKPPVPGKSDSRRDSARRGLMGIAEKGYVIIENDTVRLSAVSQNPANR